MYFDTVLNIAALIGAFFAGLFLLSNHYEWAKNALKVCSQSFAAIVATALLLLCAYVALGMLTLFFAVANAAEPQSVKAPEYTPAVKAYCESENGCEFITRDALDFVRDALREQQEEIENLKGKLDKSCA